MCCVDILLGLKAEDSSLVICLQRQAPELRDLRARIGIADRLVDPCGANLLMGKRLTGQRTPLALRQSEEGVGDGGIKRLQARKLLGFGTIETQERKLESFYCSAHMSSIYNLVQYG